MRAGPDLPDPLVRVVQALVEDEELWKWFDFLRQLPVAMRAAELRQTAARIRAGGRP